MSTNNRNTLRTVDWFPLKVVKPKKSSLSASTDPNQQQLSSDNNNNNNNYSNPNIVPPSSFASDVSNSNNNNNNNDNNSNINDAGTAVPPNSMASTSATSSFLDSDPTSFSGGNLGAMLLNDPNFLNQRISSGDDDENEDNNNNNQNLEGEGNTELLSNSGFHFAGGNGRSPEQQENNNDENNNQNENNIPSSSSLGGAFALTNSFTFHFRSNSGNAAEEEKDIIEDVTAMGFLACSEDVISTNRGGGNRKRGRGRKSKSEHQQTTKTTTSADAVDELLDQLASSAKDCDDEDDDSDDEDNDKNGSAIAVGDKTGRITVFAVEPSLRKSIQEIRQESVAAAIQQEQQSKQQKKLTLSPTSDDNDDNQNSKYKKDGDTAAARKREGRLGYRMLSIVSISSEVSDDHNSDESSPKRKGGKIVKASPTTTTNTNNTNNNNIDNNEEETTSSPFLEGATSTSFKGRLSHQAFSVEQDRGSYPPKKRIDEKVTCIIPVGPQMTPHSVLYLASNDILIKLYRLRSYRNAVVDESSQPFTNDVIQPLRTFVSSHQTPICALSACADQETFISADYFKVQWWNLQDDDPHHGVTLYDMQPSKDEDVTEVITNAAFHPYHGSLFLVTMSNGECRIGDLRDPPSRRRKFSATLTPTPTSENNNSDNSNNNDFTSKYTSDPLVARALKLLHGGVFLDDPYHIVTRDYMTLGLWDLRKATTAGATSSSSSSSSSLLKRKSVGMDDCLIPQMSQLFANEKIFDRFPLLTDIQQNISPLYSPEVNESPFGAKVTVGTGLYGNSVLFWNDPVRDISSGSGDTNDEKNDDDLFMYSLDEHHYAGGVVMTKQDSSGSSSSSSLQWTPRCQADKEENTLATNRVTQLAMTKHQLSFASASKIVRLKRK